MDRCEEVRSELAAFIAGEPAEDAWDGVRGHIGGCTPCADHAASLRRVWGSLGELKMEEVPPHALDRVQERIRAASRAEAAARSPDGWLLGLADGVLALIALWPISRMLPVFEFCRVCRNVVAGSPFQSWIYTGEFTAGTVLSALSVLVALLIGRVAWRSERSGRLAAAGFTYALAAILLGPNHVVVGSAVAFAAWGAGSVLGTLLVIGTTALIGPRRLGATS